MIILLRGLQWLERVTWLTKERTVCDVYNYNAIMLDLVYSGIYGDNRFRHIIIYKD